MNRRPSAALLTCLATLVTPQLSLADVSWDEATEVRIAVGSEQESDPSEYIIELFSEGDARVTVVEQTVESHDWPVILVVSGQVMLVRNLELEDGYEIDALDGAVLMLQLVLDLLQRSAAGGPSSLNTDTVEIRISEDEDTIHVGTTSASGEFPPPWQLTGELHHETGSRIAYDFRFSFPAAGQSTTLRLRGHWQSMSPRPELDPEMELSGWEAFILGPIRRELPGSTVFDYGAQRTKLQSDTLKALREELHQQ